MITATDILKHCVIGGPREAMPVLDEPDVNRHPWSQRLVGVLGVATIILGEILRHYLPRLLLDWRHSDDQQQHSWYWHRVNDPSLFPDDPLAEFFSQPSLTPVGHRWLYEWGSGLVGPEFFGDLLGTFLMGGTVVLAFLVGAAFCGRLLFGLLPKTVIGWLSVVGGLAVCVVTSRSGYFELPDGGFARGHAPPAMMLAILGLLHRSGPVTGIAAIYAALVYPIVWILIGATTFACVMFDVYRGFRRQDASWGLQRWHVWQAGVGLCVVSMLIIALMRPGQVAEQYGPKVTLEEIKANPEFGYGGRNEMVEPSALRTYFTSVRRGVEMGVRHLPWVVPVLLISIPLFGRRVPSLVWIILGTSLTLWLAANLLLPTLYLPSRYTRWVLKPLFALAAGGLVTLLLALLYSWRPTWRWKVVSIVAGSLLTGLYLSSNFVVGRHEEAVRVSRLQTHRPDMRHAWSIIADLPKDTLVAAHPLDAGPLPLMTRRSVLISTELSLAYHRGYYEKIAEPRLVAAYSAIFASDIEDVLRLHEAFGVDVVLVDERHFAADFRNRPPEVFKPFDRLVQSLHDEGRRVGFALQPPPEDRLLWSSSSGDGDGEDPPVHLVWIGDRDQMSELE